MKGLSKEVKSAIIIGVVIVVLLILGIVYGQKEKTEVADTPATTVSTTAETTAATTATTAPTTTAAATVTSANVTVPADATVKQDAQGNWALIKNDGTTVTDFTGIAKNNLGEWYVENGVVNFNFSGKVVFNGATYNVEGGKVVS